MINMLRTYLRALLKSERGATAVEYALMVTLIAVAIIGMVTALGTAIGGSFTSAAGAVSP
jgi:pilus assembly protein Flp/PilA